MREFKSRTKVRKAGRGGGKGSAGKEPAIPARLLGPTVELTVHQKVRSIAYERFALTRFTG